MSPATHFLSGWVVATLAGSTRRERAVITLAAVVPDIDGFGFFAEALTRNTSHPVTWFSDYHHGLHTLWFAVVVALAAFALCRSVKIGLLCFGMFHLHLLEDVAGSRVGPDHWPIPYLRPFSNWQWTWTGQWPLNGWQNFVITLALLIATFWLACRQGRSPVELVSVQADREVVTTIRRRLGFQT